MSTEITLPELHLFPPGEFVATFACLSANDVEYPTWFILDNVTAASSSGELYLDNWNVEPGDLASVTVTHTESGLTLEYLDQDPFDPIIKTFSYFDGDDLSILAIDLECSPPVNELVNFEGFFVREDQGGDFNGSNRFSSKVNLSGGRHWIAADARRRVRTDGLPTFPGTTNWGSMITSFRLDPGEQGEKNKLLGKTLTIHQVRFLSVLGDEDGDTLNNGQEALLHTDPFVYDIPSDLYQDYDGDGLTRSQEVFDHLTDPNDSDTDDDGLSDGDEVLVHGTNPRHSDTDGDGIQDTVELANGLNPLNPADASEDTDGDGLTNAEEIGLGTNLRVSDTDGDTLSDGDEVNVRGTKPLSTDTDGDGLSDGEEVTLGTDPLNPDTDADGFTDGQETVRASDPLDSLSFPPNAVFAATFQNSVVEEDTNTANVNAGTAIGSWTGLPDNVVMVEGMAIRESAYGNRALLLDRFESAFGPIDANAQFAHSIDLDGAIIEFDLSLLRTFPDSHVKDILIAGYDGFGNKSFEIVISAASTSGVLADEGRRIAYMDPTNGLTMVPQGLAGELVGGGGAELLEPNPDNFSGITLTCGPTGYVIHHDARPGIVSWTSDVLPYNGPATEIASVNFYGLPTPNSQAAGFWLDNMLVTSATLSDTDGDGLSDGDEVNVYGTDPTNPDTDGDGVNDGDEVANGTDPTNPDVTTPTFFYDSAAPAQTDMSPIPVMIAFNEEVTGFEVSDIVVENAVVGGFNELSAGLTYAFALTPLAPGLVRATVPAGSVTDLAGNANEDQPAFLREYVPGQYPSVVSMTRTSPNPTSSLLVRYTVLFDEQVSGVDASDFTLTTTGGIAGASITLVSGSGTSRIVYVRTGTGNGDIQLNLVDDDSIVNGIGNPLGGAGAGNGNASGPAYTIQGR